MHLPVSIGYREMRDSRPNSTRRVALVHDWLTGMRGGEKVLEELCGMFPDAPLYTLVRQPGACPPIEDGRPIFTSWIDRAPLGRSHLRWFLPLFPLAVRSLVVDRGVDLMISSSHAAAKAVRPPEDAHHVCYCHSPMRYVWDDSDDYFAFGDVRLARRIALAPFRTMLRRWDRLSASRVDLFIANSENVRRRIRVIYGRDAVVVHPPVNTEFFTPGDGPRERFCLVVSALVPYKRVDLAVRAFTETGEPLKIVGTGTELRSLERIAGPSIEFLGNVDPERLRRLYRTASALIFPGREDFGIVPVEAQACGLPVLALHEGGALETVIEGKTGLFFHHRTPTAVIEGVEAMRRATFSTDELVANAARFCADRFRREFLDALEGIPERIGR